MVVDDASPEPFRDILEEYAKKFNLKTGCLTLPRNMGASIARRAGLSKAKGEYIQFIDCDDLLEPEKLALQVATLDAQPSWIMTYSLADVINSDDKQIRPVLGKSQKEIHSILPDTLDEQYWFPGACLWRKTALREDAWKAVDTCNAQLFDWIIGLSGGAIGYTSSEKPLAHKRFHTDSHSLKNGDELILQKEKLRVIEILRDEWKMAGKPSLGNLRRKLALRFARKAPIFLHHKEYQLARVCIEQAEALSPSVLSNRERFIFKTSKVIPPNKFLWKLLHQSYKFEKWLER